MKVRSVQLQEVCDVVMGQSPPSSTYNLIGDGLPFFQGKADFGELHPKIRVFCNKPSRVAEVGDILISVRAPVGPTNITRQRCCIGRGLAALRPRNELNSKFLLYFLRYYEPRIATLGQGSTFDAINRDDLEETELPLPSVVEQQRIAKQLEKTDRLRRTRRYALQLSDSLVPAVFLQFFGDPVRNKRDWPKLPLLDACENITDGTHDTPDRVKSGVPFVTSKNIRPFEFDLADLEFVTPETHREIIKRCNPRYGDVLYTNIGVNVGNAVANRLPFEFSLKNVALIQPDFSRLDSSFLEALVNDVGFRKDILRVSSVGGAQKFVSLEVLRGIEIVLPPLALQTEFAKLVARVERLRSVQREALRQSEHLFQTLLRRAFIGQNMKSQEQFARDVTS